MTLTQEVKRIVPSRLDEKAKKLYNRLKDETDNFDVDVLVIFPELATAVEEFIEVIKKKYPEAIKKTKPAETPPPPPPAPDSDDKEVLEAMRDYRISELKAKRLIELRNEASESKKESIDKMLETLKKSEFYDTRYTSKRNIDKNRTRDVKKDSNRGSLTAKDELNMTGRRYKRISKAGHKNQYGTTEGGKVYYEYRANRRDIDHKIKMAKGDVIKGGGVERERYNLSFNYNPSNLSNEDAEKIVEEFTKDWKHDNDWDNVSFYVFNLTKQKADELKATLEMEDVFNVEIEKSRFDNGGRVEGRFKKHFNRGGKIEIGDNVNVIAENKSGVVVNIISHGKYFTIQFVDGTKNVYDKNEIQKIFDAYDEYSKGGGVDSGAVKGRFKKHFGKGGWVLYDEDTQKEIKTYKTESEARKDLYEYEGNGNIVKKSVWDKSIEPKVDRLMFEEEMYEYERGGLIDADLYYDMLGAVPPLYISELNGEKQMGNNTFAVGEAYDYTDTPDGYKATYQAFSKKGNLFFDEGLIYFTSRGIAKSVEPKIDRFMFEDEMYEYGKGGMINGKYLDNISTAKKQEILTNIARHYGITNAEAEKEVRDSEAEMLYEYISNNPSLRMEIYRGIEK